MKCAWPARRMPGVSLPISPLLLFPLLALLGLSCSPEISPTPGTADRSIAALLSANGDLMADRWIVSRQRIIGIEFEGTFETPELQLSVPHSLYFIPTILEAPVPLEYRLEVLTEGEERLLYMRDIAKDGTFPCEEYLVARVDLREFTHQAVVLRWSCVAKAGGEVLGKGMIGAPRLVPTARRPEYPHVVLICSDTHRYDFSLGPESADLMPAFQEFCGDSIVFDNAFANATWTVPSTASVLTGLEPYYHGAGWRVEANRDLLAREGMGPVRPRTKRVETRNYSIIKHDPSLLTVQEVLWGKGYYPLSVVENSWLVFGEILNDGFAASIRPKRLAQFGFGRATSVDWLRRIVAKRPPQAPLFLYLHSNHVHSYLNDVGHNEKTGRLPAADYLDSYANRVKDFDGQFAEFMRILKDSGIYDDAFIVFYSDHGELLPHTDEDVGHGKTMRESLLHVPLVMKLPARYSVPSRRIEEAVQLIDIAPTIVEVAFRPERFQSAQYPFRGQSLVPLMVRGESLASRDMYSSIQFNLDELIAVRRGNWKYVYNLNKENGILVAIGSPGQYEEHDRASTNGAVADELHGLVMGQWRHFIENTLNKGYESFDDPSEEQLEELKSLGYLD